jgi:hypothetical protein
MLLQWQHAAVALARARPLASVVDPIRRCWSSHRRPVVPAQSSVAAPAQRQGQWRRRRRGGRSGEPGEVAAASGGGSSGWAQQMRENAAARAATARGAAAGEAATVHGGARPAARSGGNRHLLWSTPVYTVNWLEQQEEESEVDAEWNQRLATIAGQGYRRFAAREQHQLAARLAAGEQSWLAHAWFEWQLLQWHSCGGWADLYGSAEFALLERLILEAISRSRMLPHSTLSGGSGGQGAAAEPTLMVWAATHHDGSSHAPHVHDDALLSGTYYAVRWSPSHQR